MEKLGNPIVAATIAEKIEKDDLKNIGSAVSKGAKNLALILVIGFSIYQGNKWLRNRNIRKFLEKNADKPEVHASFILYNAMFDDVKVNYFGLFDFTVINTTDEKALYKIAADVESIETLSKVYYKLFRRTLTTDIKTELTSSELQTFYKIIQINSSIVQTYAKNTKVYAKNNNVKSYYLSDLKIETNVSWNAYKNDCCRHQLKFEVMINLPLSSETDRRCPSGFVNTAALASN